MRRLGREMLDRIAEPLIAGIHAAEPSTMSLATSFLASSTWSGSIEA